MTALVPLPESEDWLRSMRWDLPPQTWDEWVAYVGGEAHLAEWVGRSCMLAAPKDIADGYRAWGKANRYDASLFKAMGTNPARVAAVSALLAAGDFVEEEHPREHGRFVAKDKSEKPTKGRRGKGTPDDPIRGVKSADEALALIHDGKYVEMDPNLIAVSMDRLAEINREARALGEKAPLYDLCKITASDKSLFCGEAIVQSRLEMPQLKGVPLAGSQADLMPKDDKGEVNLVPALQDALQHDGVAIRQESVDAQLLKASQNQLNGAKVAGMIEGRESGAFVPGPILVSSDNYVVDGHHTWASAVGVSWDEAHPVEMPILRVDMPIQQILDYTNAFTMEMGIPPAQAAVGAVVEAFLTEMAYAWLAAEFVEDEHPREHGRFVTKDKPAEPEQESVDNAAAGVSDNAMTEASYYLMDTDDWRSLDIEDQQQVLDAAQEYEQSGMSDSLTFEDWYAVQNAGEYDEKIGESERFSRMVDNLDYRPSGEAAIDHLEYEHAWDSMKEHADIVVTDAAQSATDMAAEARETLAGMEPGQPGYQALDDFATAVEQANNGDTEALGTIIAAAAQQEMLGLRNDGATLMSSPQDIAAVLMSESGRFANEAMLNGEKGNYTGDARAQAENDNIGVPFDARPEDRPIYSSTLNEDSVGLLASFGSVAVDLKPEVFDRSTVALGDLLHVANAVPYRDLAAMDPTNYDDRIQLLGATSTAASSEFVSNEYSSMVPDSQFSTIEWDGPWRQNDWAEIQIHGGLTLADVREIGVPTAEVAPDDSLALTVINAQAEAKGVSTYEYNDAAYNRSDMGL